MKLVFLMALTSLSLFSDCLTNKVTCLSGDINEKDYILTSKECLYGEMDQYSSEIHRYTKTFSYFTEINKIEKTETITNFSNHEFYKDNYKDILVSYQVSQFSIYNREMQEIIYIDLKDHDCTITKANTRK